MEAYTLADLEDEVRSEIEIYRRDIATGRFNRRNAELLIIKLHGSLDNALNIHLGLRDDQVTETTFNKKFEKKLPELFRADRIWELTEVRNDFGHMKVKYSDLQFQKIAERYIQVVEEARQQGIFDDSGIFRSPIYTANVPARQQEIVNRPGYGKILVEDVTDTARNLGDFLRGVISFLIRFALFYLISRFTLAVIGYTLLLAGDSNPAQGVREFWSLLAIFTLIVNVRLLIFLFGWEFPRFWDVIFSIASISIIWFGLSLPNDYISGLSSLPELMRLLYIDLAGGTLGSALSSNLLGFIYPLLILSFSVGSFIINTTGIYRAKHSALRH